MKSIKYLVLFVFALTLTITSCKKDEDSKSKKELLTSKSWIMLSSKTNGEANVLDDCIKDDILTFSSTGTWTYNPATIKCDSEEMIDTGTWSLSSDEKYLIMDGFNVTIVELTESRFVFSSVSDKYNTETTLISF